MPYGEPESTDPHELVGVALPGDESATREMATAFAEEFARLGFGRERLLSLFRRPGYRAARAALDALGEKEIERIVDEALVLWGGLRVVVTDGDPDPEPGAASPRPRRFLRVL